MKGSVKGCKIISTSLRFHLPTIICIFIAAMIMNEVLEAEREQLQRELNQRLADCGTTHATSVAELEKVQADLSARLSASEIRACTLESERNAIVQKLNATVRAISCLLISYLSNLVELNFVIFFVLGTLP